MRFLIVALTLAGSLASTFGALCHSADDCAENRCCMAENLYRKGVCMKFGRLGRRCSEPDAKLDYFQGKYYKYCPCEKGLECRPKFLREGVTERAKVLDSLRCQEPLSTSAATSDAPTSNSEGFTESDIEETTQKIHEEVTEEEPTGDVDIVVAKSSGQGIDEENPDADITYDDIIYEESEGQGIDETKTGGEEFEY